MLVCFGGMEGGGLLNWVREMGAGELRGWVWFGDWSGDNGGGRRMSDAAAEVMNSVRTAEERRRIMVRWNACFRSIESDRQDHLCREIFCRGYRVARRDVVRNLVSNISALRFPIAYALQVMAPVTCMFIKTRLLRLELMHPSWSATSDLYVRS